MDTAPLTTFVGAIEAVGSGLGGMSVGCDGCGTP